MSSPLSSPARSLRASLSSSGEARLVPAAFLALFGVLCAQTLLETARDTLFLTHLSVAELPWIHLTLAFLTLAAGGLSAATARWRGRWRRGPARGTPASMASSLWLGVAVTAALGVTLVRGNRAAVYLLFLWSGMFSGLSVTKIWTLLAETIDVSRAKRLYGKLAAGAGAGAVTGAALARICGPWLSPHGLVLLAAGIVALTALGPGRVLAGAVGSDPDGRGDSSGRPGAVIRTIADPYVARLLVTTLLATAVATLLDYSFKAAVAAHLPAERLPAFLASFHLTTSVASLLAQLFGLAVVVRVVGVRRAQLVFPLLLLAGVVLAAASGGLASVVLVRALDGAFRNSFHRPSSELLQVALPDRLRRRAKPIIDVIALRGGQAAGALVLVAMMAASAGPGILMAVVGALLVGWLLLAHGLGRRYVDLLRSSLIGRGALAVARVDGPALDGETLAPVLAAIERGTETEVMAGLDVLAAHHRAALIGGRGALETLVSLLERRQGRAAARAALARTPQAFEAVYALLTDPARAASVRAHAPRALVEIDAPRSVGPLLDGLLLERDGFVRYRILRALHRVRRARPETPLDEDILGRAALAAVRSAHRYLAWRLFLEDGARRVAARGTSTRALLCDLLAEKEENAVERLFLVLALRYPREDFRRLLRELRSGACRARAAGRELVENLLRGPARALTLALVDEADDRTRLLVLAGGQPPRAPTDRRLLAAIREEEEGGMLGALAAHHAEELSPDRPRAPAAGRPGVARA